MARRKMRADALQQLQRQQLMAVSTTSPIEHAVGGDADDGAAATGRPVMAPLAIPPLDPSALYTNIENKSYGTPSRAGPGSLSSILYNSNTRRNKGAADEMASPLEPSHAHTFDSRSERSVSGSPTSFAGKRSRTVSANSSRPTTGHGTTNATTTKRLTLVELNQQSAASAALTSLCADPHRYLGFLSVCGAADAATYHEAICHAPASMTSVAMTQPSTTAEEEAAHTPTAANVVGLPVLGAPLSPQAPPDATPKHSTAKARDLEDQDMCTDPDCPCRRTPSDNEVIISSMAHNEGRLSVNSILYPPSTISLSTKGMAADAKSSSNKGLGYVIDDADAGAIGGAGASMLAKQKNDRFLSLDTLLAALKQTGLDEWMLMDVAEDWTDDDDQNPQWNKELRAMAVAFDKPVEKDQGASISQRSLILPNEAKSAWSSAWHGSTNLSASTPPTREFYFGGVSIPVGKDGLTIDFKHFLYPLQEEFQFIMAFLKDEIAPQASVNTAPDSASSLLPTLSPATSTMMAGPAPLGLQFSSVNFVLSPADLDLIGLEVEGEASTMQSLIDLQPQLTVESSSPRGVTAAVPTPFTMAAVAGALASSVSLPYIASAYDATDMRSMRRMWARQRQEAALAKVQRQWTQDQRFKAGQAVAIAEKNKKIEREAALMLQQEQCVARMEALMRTPVVADTTSDSDSDTSSSSSGKETDEADLFFAGASRSARRLTAVPSEDAFQLPTTSNNDPLSDDVKLNEKPTMSKKTDTQSSAKALQRRMRLLPPELQARMVERQKAKEDVVEVLRRRAAALDLKSSDEEGEPRDGVDVADAVISGFQSIPRPSSSTPTPAPAKLSSWAPLVAGSTAPEKYPQPTPEDYVFQAQKALLTFGDDDSDEVEAREDDLVPQTNGPTKLNPLLASVTDGPKSLDFASNTQKDKTSRPPSSVSSSRLYSADYQAAVGNKIRSAGSLKKALASTVPNLASTENSQNANSVVSQALLQPTIALSSADDPLEYLPSTLLGQWWREATLTEQGLLESERLKANRAITLRRGLAGASAARRSQSINRKSGVEEEADTYEPIVGNTTDLPVTTATVDDEVLMAASEQEVPAATSEVAISLPANDSSPLPTSATTNPTEERKKYLLRLREATNLNKLILSRMPERSAK
eukprot:GILI01007816.1.p1 GENE.GILI01007816.1~~GILI01007816.1.p1  ORF type:complete len:1320 (+),score=296.34 GILI01007816.1:503-3961(+)